MPLSLLNHSALALFAQRTRIPTSARSIGFCAIWVCISSSSIVSLCSKSMQRFRPTYDIHGNTASCGLRVKNEDVRLISFLGLVCVTFLLYLLAY
jgi:hypothetical protein